MRTDSVTFICKHLANGGAERVMSELITAFAKKGYYVQVIMLYDEIYEKDIEYKIPETVEIVKMNWKADRKVLQAVIHNSKLRKQIKGNFIISMLYPATEAAIIAGKILRKKVIVSERNYPKLSPPTRKGRFIRNIMFHFADKCVFQTHEAMNYFPASIRRKGVVIPNPIKPDIPEMFIGERSKKIAVVGRLEQQKNHPMMLRVFQRFLLDYPDYELHIFSRGPLLEELEDYAEMLNIKKKVFFEGFVNNVNQIIRDYTMYISTSNYEGMSNAMLEALAMGIPSICTDCPAGGAREAITNGVNGILIQVGDESALLGAMKRIAENKDFAYRLGLEAVKVREKYKIDNIINLWQQLLI